jgi:4-amino-4-deoxy-L-arabinose transferase-like glycosyltransferase
VLAGLIYFYRLNYIPSGFYVDEAVVAYNAFSILETGKDIFAQPYPVLFRLLGSYTPSLFIYVSAIFIKLFGYSPIVFRSISAISALVSIIFLHLFISKLKIFRSGAVTFFTVLFYATSPWLVFNARHGYEVTLGYLLFNVGIYFLYLSINNPKSLIWVSIFLSLATYVSHTQRYMLPVFLLFFLALFWKRILAKKNIKTLILSSLIFLAIQVPNLTVIGTNAFWVKNARLTDQSGEKIVGSVINQFFAYISPRNIFYELTDIDMQHTIPETSVVQNFLVIPYLLGLFLLVKKRKEDSIKYLILLFFAALIPATFSGEFISIQRALPFLLPLTLVIGLGIDKLRDKLPLKLFTIILSFFFAYSLFMLYRSYFILFPRERAGAWNYGYSQVSDFIKVNSGEKFVIDNSRNPRNYILLLYYLKYPPLLYQNEVPEIYKNNYYQSLPPETSYKFSNIEIRPIDWENDSYIDQIIIGDQLTISETQAKEHFLKKVNEIYDFFNNPIFVVYKTSPLEKCKMDFNKTLCDKY